MTGHQPPSEQKTAVDRLKSVPDSPLVFDSAQRYACQDCDARCCKFPWKILLDQKEAERLLAVPWITQRFRESGTWLIQEGRFYRLPRAPHSSGSMACVFLGEDNACTIQQREGHDILPYTCQSYPFSFLERANPADDEAVHTVNSYFCKSIQQNTGEALRGKVKHKFRMTHQVGRVLTLPEQVSLGKRLTLNGRDFSALSSLLMSHWDDPNLSARDALWAGYALLWGLSRQKALPDLASLRPTSFSPKSLALPNPQPNKGGMAGQALLTLFLASPALLGAQDAAMVSRASAVSSVSTVAIPRLNAGAFYRLLMNLHQRRGRVRFWGVPETVWLDTALKQPFDELEQDSQVFLKRYYRQFIQSQWLFYTQEDVLKNYLILMMTYPYALLLARCLAEARNRETGVLMQDLEEAVGLADVLASMANQRGAGNLDKLKHLVLAFVCQRPALSVQVLSV